MDTLTPAQQNIANKVAHLLAESPLDDEIKNGILENIDKLTEVQLFELKDMLEAEREQLKNFTFEMEEYIKQRDANWQKLETDQKAVAQKVIDNFVRKTEEAIKAEEADSTGTTAPTPVV